MRYDFYDFQENTFIKALSLILHLKPRSHMTEYFFQLFTIDINSAIANNLKPIRMMKIQCVTIYLNIYECVSDYMEIYHGCF